jgi:hypothetical protein
MASGDVVTRQSRERATSDGRARRLSTPTFAGLTSIIPQTTARASTWRRNRQRGRFFRFPVCALRARAEPDKESTSREVASKRPRGGDL